MGKLYTLDGKLLTETPEIRIGEKVYPVDSRQKTVKKILALSDDESVPMGERIDEALKLALGKDASESLLLADAAVRPDALLSSGFEFEHPTFDDALADLTGSRSAP